MIALLVTLAACDPAASAAAPPAPATPAAAPAPAAGTLVGTVEETVAAGSYTYTRIRTPDGAEAWAAAPGAAPAVGSTVSVSTALPMANFHSETLKRDFPTVYFVEALGPVAAAAAATDGAPPAWHPKLEGDEECGPVTAEGATAAAALDAQPVLAATTPKGPALGDRTVAQVWAERAAIGGREVTVKGRVTKFTGGVMGSNWLHVTDGTGAEGTDDLTVTSADTAAVGDEVELTGVVGVDRDFGYGYRYPVIVTDARVKVVKAGGT
ncbi:MAG: TOBE domain-containing protein [Myxococcota bacterium]